LPALPLELLALPPVEVSKVPPREPQRPEAEWCAAVAERSLPNGARLPEEAAKVIRAFGRELRSSPDMNFDAR